MTLADLAIVREPANLPRFVEGLSDSNEIIRYWAALGCLMLRDKATPAKEAIAKGLADPSPHVRVVLAEAAWLLGAPMPPAVSFHAAALSPMAAGFWAESRRVASTLTQRMLGYRWRYPEYRAGLRAILAEQRRDGAGEQGQIGRA